MDRTALDLLRAQPKGTLCDRVGGKRGLYAAVDGFYAKVLEDLLTAALDLEVYRPQIVAGGRRRGR